MKQSRNACIKKKSQSNSPILWINMGALTGLFPCFMHLQIYKKACVNLITLLVQSTTALAERHQVKSQKRFISLKEVFRFQTSFCQWHSFLNTGSIQNICKCNTQHEGKSIPQRKRELKPQTSFYTWSQTTFWCLRHTRMALSGEQRSRTPGRRLYTVEPLGHGEAGCRLTPGY